MFTRLQEDMKQAMKDRNSEKVTVLRMVISEIKNKTVNEGKEITDDICLQVIRRSIKQHEDSIKQFIDAKREDLASKESLELCFLKFYLPNMLSEDETKKLVDKIIKEGCIIKSKKSMGIIMKELKRFSNLDMKLASKYLNEILVP